MKKTKRKLLNRAKVVFSQKGFTGTSVSDIVSSMGVARGTFYNYFKNKNHVYRELLKELTLQIKGCLKPIKNESDFYTQLERNIESLLELFVKDRELARVLLFHQFNVDPQTDRIIEDFFEELRVFVKNALEKGIKGGYLRNFNTEVGASLILGGFIQIAKEIAVGRYLDESIERLASEIVDFGVRGIRC